MTFPACIEADVPLSAVTYYGIGGVAAHVSRPRSLREIRDTLAFARERGLPLAVLGSGSNSVCSDARFEGVVLSLSEFNRWHWLSEDRLHVEAGVTNTEIAEACLEAGRAGGGWMYRMPGLAGASVRMNARCYGGEISHVVESVTTMNVRGALRTWRADEVFKGYKNTSLMESPEIVVSCIFRFPVLAPRADSLAVMETCESDRHGKHHFDHPSCGSTFKNNYAVGKPSGRVFDELGLKGTRVGACAVSDHHANFVWNLGSARAADMLGLAGLMRGKALAAGADLELEVQPIGLFDEATYETCALERLGPAALAEGGRRWVGLTWHPGGLECHTEKGTPHVSARTEPFPRTLLSLRPEEYFRAPNAGLPEVAVALEQLRSVAEAKANPSLPFLRWSTRVAEAERGRVFPSSPDAPAGTFVDELWTSSVSEIFFAHPLWTCGSEWAPYLEFEMTPAGHWIALAFDAYRTRTRASSPPSEAIWGGVSRFVTPPDQAGFVSFGMTFAWQAIAAVAVEGADQGEAAASPAARISAQCALSLGGGRYFLAPHWVGPLAPGGAVETHCHRLAPTAKPDFHQPARYFPIELD